ncbi:hypothetical protein I5U23_14765 [Stenotrophomonas maltophilia]|uniref:J domain-containing protein n=1 Tax=Stenotrophomonas riyadhensis TaxID=2859893 RepID=A0ABT2XIU2_9GAMM|nr:hypothetical protein [Stenotrophomonas sp. CFS3442]MBH1619178.1 hypothetical protein [Stenotrophomonas maltophilia]MCV0325862.1 J domain-containing protein [Stenotrophomonas sp. CFS3442]HEL4245251.1 hypothetical protein [Stenotrophomonas maltophilia]
MSWGLSFLGLDAAADERAIKRAYAQRLRLTRPDEDPAGFQQLHEAYQAALTWLTARDADAPALASGPATRHAIDPAAVATQLAAVACGADNAHLVQVLQQRPELWSLRDKTRIGYALLEHLAQTEPALSPAAWDTLSACFGWDDVAFDRNRASLDAIALRCNQHWWLSPAGLPELSQRYLRINDVLLVPGSDVLPSLRERRPFWRNLTSTLQPSRAQQAIGLLTALGYWYDRRLPPGLDGGQVAFWARFAREGDTIHLLSSGLRVLITALVMGLICSWAVFSSWPMPPSEDGTLSRTQRAVLSIVIAVLLVPTLWLAAVVLGAFVRWQATPEHLPAALPWLRTAAIPLGVLASYGGLYFALHNTTGVPVAGLVAVGLFNAMLLFVAWQRYARRKEAATATKLGPLEVVSILLIVPAALLALAYWLIDLRLHGRPPRASDR